MTKNTSIGSGTVINDTGITLSGRFYGVRIGGTAAEVDNAGLIIGTRAGSSGILLGNGGLVTNLATGEIDGDLAGIKVSVARGTITNAAGGAIVAKGTAGYGIQLNAGGSVQNSGSIHGGKYGVQINGQSGTVRGSGTVNSGTVLNVGTIDGGSYGVAINTASGTVRNSGTISGSIDAVVFSGTTNGRLIIDVDARFLGKVDGGGRSTLEMASGSSTGTISGLGTQFVDFTQATVDAGASWVFDGSDTVTTGVILAADAMLSNGGRISGSDGVVMMAEGTLSNSGRISGSNGVVALGTASIINAASGSIVGTTQAINLRNGGSVLNAGTIRVVGQTNNAINVGGMAGTVVNQQGGVIDGVFLTAGGSIENFGSIGGVYVTDGQRYGAAIIGGGTIVNHTGASMYGCEAGMVLSGGGIAVNSGNVDAVGYGAIVEDSTLQNSGHIGGYACTGAISANASVENSGTIVGKQYGLLAYGYGRPPTGHHEAGAPYGVVGAASLAGDMPVNAGVIPGYSHSLITNHGGAVIASEGVGLGLTGGATAWNDGSIAGGAGLYLGGYSGIAGATFANSISSMGVPVLFNAADGIVTGTVSYGAIIEGVASLVNDGMVGGVLAGVEGVYGCGNGLSVVNNASGTITATGSASSGIELVGGGSVSNSGLVSGVLHGLYARKVAAEVTNLAGGQILATGGTSDGIRFAAGGSIENYGSIGGGNRGIYARAVAATISNGVGGAITGAGYGIEMTAGGDVQNSAAITGGYAGVFANLAAAYVTNAAGGVIAATGSNGSGVVLLAGGSVYNGWKISGVKTGLYIKAVAATATNGANGVISGTGTAGIGAQLKAGGSLLNSGSIDGAKYGVAVTGSTGTLRNAGTISGGGKAVVFSGHTTGRLIVDGTAAFNGAVDGGGGSALELASAASTGTLSGSTQIGNFQTATVDAGASWAIDSQVTVSQGITLNAGVMLKNSGSISDSQIGIFAKSTATVINADGGSIDGAARLGIDLNAGGSVDNSGTIHGNNSGVFINNGFGNVTNQTSGLISANSYANSYYNEECATVELRAGGRVLNSGTVNGSWAGIFVYHGGTITNDATGVVSDMPFDLALYGAGTVINGGSISGANTGVWIGSVDYQDSPASFTNLAGGIITSSGYGVRLNDGGTAQNSGLISGDAAGLYALQGGTIINTAEGVIAGTGREGAVCDRSSGTSAASANATDSESGMGGSSRPAASPISLGQLGAGVITSAQSSGALTYSFGIILQAGGSVTNSGTIIGPSVAILARNNPASIINTSSGEIVTEAPCKEAQSGIKLLAGGRVDNAGSIAAWWQGIYVAGGAGVIVNGSTGAITSGYKHGIALRSGGSVSNSGLISGAHGGINISQHGEGTVTNAASGVIAGLDSYSFGIELKVAGSVQNSGSITGGQDGIAVTGATGTVRNAGVISGGNAAVTFSGTTMGLLIVDAGASFTALVEGGGLSTLELAADAYMGTISGLGMQFVHFQQERVDGGASWTLAGKNLIASGSTLINGGTVTVAGTLVQSGTWVNDGGSIVDAGLLWIAAGETLGGGTVTFSGSGALQDDTLRDSGLSSMDSAIANFDVGNELDLRGLSYLTGATATFADGVLTVSSGGNSVRITLTTPMVTQFMASSDGEGGTEVHAVNTPPVTLPPAPLIRLADAAPGPIGSSVMLNANTASVSAGLNAPVLSFLEAPATTTLSDTSPEQVSASLSPSLGIQQIANFHYGLDQLDLDLMGAASGLLQACDTMINGKAAISLYSSSDPTHGIVLTARGTANFTTAADLLANHLAFGGGHAVIS